MQQQGEEGRGVDNGLERGHDVGNSLDREHVDVVDDNRATRTQTDNRNGHAGNCETIYQFTILGVAVERGPAIAIVKWASPPCPTLETMQ